MRSEKAYETETPTQITESQVKVLKQSLEDVDSYKIFSDADLRMISWVQLKKFPDFSRAVDLLETYQSRFDSATFDPDLLSSFLDSDSIPAENRQTFLETLVR